jgi:GNAT superfamily N-acetyltransferase
MDPVIKGYLPGAIGRITQLHATYYSQNWGFGLFFEAKVAAELSAFLSRFETTRDGFWTLCDGNRIEGSLAIDGIHAHEQGAHLRWFILSEHLHGKGWGNRLMKAAMGFCHNRGYRRVYLWTFEGLFAARHLYEKFGFRLTEQHDGKQWGARVREQKFVRQLP